MPPEPATSQLNIRPEPPRPRRLTRSSRERMWAGVAGGLGEYFEIDPSLIRLLWVLAAVLSGGLAVPVYILAWIILPRDDRPPVHGPQMWRDWSHEFHTETQRLAEEARRTAQDMQAASTTQTAPPTATSTAASDAPTPERASGTGDLATSTTEPGSDVLSSATEPGSDVPTSAGSQASSASDLPTSTNDVSTSTSEPPTSTGNPPPYGSSGPPYVTNVSLPPPPPAPEYQWSDGQEVEPRRSPNRHPRQAGILLVGLGVLFLAANAGFFSLIDFKIMWPAILIGLGVILLARQSTWGR